MKCHFFTIRLIVYFYSLRYITSISYVAPTANQRLIAVFLRFSCVKTCFLTLSSEPYLFDRDKSPIRSRGYSILPSDGSL